jgi:AraC family mar-sox-rob regulon transcriptional activator
MREDQFIHSLLVWIETNLDKNLNLDEVALRAGYSKWHLQRLFKRKTGVALAQYIRQRRLTESALALLNTDMSIVSVVEEFGFDTQQTYTRTFKKYFQVTPGQLRRSKRVKPERLFFSPNSFHFGQ